MQMLMIGYTRTNPDGRFISPDFKRLIIDEKVDEISLLNPAALDTSGLEDELKEIVGDDCVRNYDEKKNDTHVGFYVPNNLIWVRLYVF